MEGREFEFQVKIASSGACMPNKYVLLNIGRDTGPLEVPERGSNGFSSAKIGIPGLDPTSGIDQSDRPWEKRPKDSKRY